MPVTPTALMRPQRSKQSSLSEVTVASTNLQITQLEKENGLFELVKLADE